MNDYYAYQAQRQKPEPKPREKPEKSEPIEVEEGDASDTFVGKVRKFWDTHKGSS